MNRDVRDYLIGVGALPVGVIDLDGEEEGFQADEVLIVVAPIFCLPADDDDRGERA